MNKNALESVMKLHGDNGGTLAKYLHIARSTFSAKINETNGAEFTQNEIRLIKDKYDLCAQQIDSIFFDQQCLNKTQLGGEQKMKTDTQTTIKRKTVREISDEVMEILKKEHLTADKAWDVLEAVRRKVHESAFSKQL